MNESAMIFDRHAQEYDRWFDLHDAAFQSELLALRKVMPDGVHALEIGVGTGRFALALNIQTGLEPAEGMAEIARSRGIHVINGFAEQLPFHDSSFDTVVMITVLCFLKDPENALAEIKRIIKPNGVFVLAILDKESPLGKMYQQTKESNEYFRNANFFSAEACVKLLDKAGFAIEESWQTLFGLTAEDVQQPQPGYGQGGFVVFKTICKY